MKRIASQISLGVTLLKIILPVCLIALGVTGFWYYKSKVVKFKRKPAVKTAPVVDIMKVNPSRVTAQIRAMGTVQADREVVIKSQVAGTVIQVAPEFVQGGLIRKGQLMVRIDPADYELAVNKAQSALAQAQADFEIEKGRQQIAREELKLMSMMSPNEVQETSLVLRKPQLEQAGAAVASAQSDLETARLDLERTRIIAPFHALVRSKEVDAGAMTAAQGALATLVDVTCYQVEVQVPLDRLDRIRVHETNGSPVRIRSLYAGREWDGHVVRTTGAVTEQSRMAGVIIRVDDPLGLGPAKGRPAMLLDDHVEALIEGQVFDNVFSLPRTLIREDSSLWIYKDGRLEIRKVAPVWIENDRVFIQSGLSPGDLVVCSDLSAPVSGMAVTLALGESR
ncbi:MAG: efflux RND transporter periplasmic adaptor subunit [Desulfobacter postgatei]|uniref:efflux RND transporter periplasmic adaptor subunit n=1 Tax=Desulfobacter postgatei TaxID=2293 RepID=UPI0023F4693F|nr:efflux RND transporter periplasmic adaptor subunit [Desulfobacter postgatei]MDD4275123.1 efflux RND transporter periplasmic adaptor subunit [Desulfobacter postgatei]